MNKREIRIANSEKINRDRFNKAMQLSSMCTTLRITDSSINLGGYMAHILRSSTPGNEAMQFFRNNFEIRVNTGKEEVRNVKLVRNNIEYSVQEEWFNWITKDEDTSAIKSEATIITKFKKLGILLGNMSGCVKVKQQLIMFIALDIATVIVVINILNVIKHVVLLKV